MARNGPLQWRELFPQFRCEILVECGIRIFLAKGKIAVQVVHLFYERFNQHATLQCLQALRSRVLEQLLPFAFIQVIGDDVFSGHFLHLSDSLHFVQDLHGPHKIDPFTLDIIGSSCVFCHHS